MVKGRKTEKTYRHYLMENLTKNISDIDFVIYDEISFTFPSGKKYKIPDIVILDSTKIEETEDEICLGPNSIISIIESKKEDINSGMIQVLGYRSDLSDYLRQPNSCFSTNFKSVIGAYFEDSSSRIDEDFYGKTITDDTIIQVSSFICDIINETKTLPKIELKDDIVIKIFDAAVDELTLYTKSLPLSQRERLTGLFFAKTLNPTIMRKPEVRNEFNIATKRAAAYLIVNQIFFYHILSSEDGEYSPLSKITTPKGLQKYFNKVLKFDYEPIYRAKIVELLPKESTFTLNNIIDAVQGLRLENIRHDLIGKVFHGLIPEGIRKRVAAYYTTNAAGDILSELSIYKKDDIVIDPACGSGTLLVTSYNKKKELYGYYTPDVHRKLLNQIYGIDICLFAAHLAAVHLSLQDVIEYTEKVSILVEDSFNVMPGHAVISFEDILVKDKLIVKGQPKLPKADVIIMNPPFTSLERIENKYLKRIYKVLKNEGKGKYIGGRGFGLYVTFLLHVDEFLKKGGRIAAVIPESLLTFVQTVGIKKFLLNNYSIDYIISSEVQTTFSEQCDFKEILLLTTKKGEGKNTKFISLKVLLSIENAINLANKFKDIDYDYEDDDFRVRIVSKKELKNDTHWVKFLRPKTIIDEYIKDDDMLVPGENLFGNSMEGMRPLGKDFFYIPNKYWEIKSKKSEYFIIESLVTEEKLKIPKKYFLKCLRIPRIHSGYITPKLEYYLLSIPDKHISQLPKDVGRYIKWGQKALGVEEIPAIKLGFDWYSHVYQKMEDRENKKVAILEKFLPTTKGVSAHFLRGTVAPFGAYYYMTMEDAKYDKALVAWFNSSIGLEYRYRNRAVLGKASERLLGTHIDRMPWLNVNLLTDKELKSLSDSLEKIKKYEPLPPISEQIGKKYRRDLDIAVLKCLGIPQENMKEILDSVYYNLKTWIANIDKRK